MKQPGAIQGEIMQARGGEPPATLIIADGCLNKRTGASARGRAALLFARCDTLSNPLSARLKHSPSQPERHDEDLGSSSSMIIDHAKFSTWLNEYSGSISPCETIAAGLRGTSSPSPASELTLRSRRSQLLLRRAMTSRLNSPCLGPRHVVLHGTIPRAR